MAHSFGTVEKTDILSLLDVTESDMADPRIVRKVHTVFRYFESKPTYRKQILKILRKDRRDNKIDAVWTWVELANEQDRIVSEMPHDEFTDEVQEQLKSGFLSREQLKEIKAQLEKRKREEAVSEYEKSQEEFENKAQEIYGERTVNKALNAVSSDHLMKRVEEYEAVTRELEAYE